MDDAVWNELVEIAEKHRALLPDGFLIQRDHIAACLERGERVGPLVFRSGAKGRKHLTIPYAVMSELRLLLCTGDERYAEVRRKGESFVKGALPAVSGFIAGSCGVSEGVATACVAFIALCVFKIGVGAFCQVAAEP